MECWTDTSNSGRFSSTSSAARCANTASSAARRASIASFAARWTSTARWTSKTSFAAAAPALRVEDDPSVGRAGTV